LLVRSVQAQGAQPLIEMKSQRIKKSHDGAEEESTGICTRFHKPNTSVLGPDFVLDVLNGITRLARNRQGL